ncbi:MULTISPECIES: translation initiation factor IF-2 [Fusobacterium]|uniref:Translation initiation factor IF-2 n=4 Tax=Fusobacterium TaxID=848 RepID=K1GNG4_9FUSO|nr:MULTISPECIES: translation initiation factor IF-2 [Fusobacterium]ATV36367.1 translation initiation factor IF-2 [Fusobacterium pseudoperiodonticum]ATV60728.1 translation initiation factor IF-2 [Fusobacterium pseudoperiodonticum]AVQ26124.1 translation initiation factor IF-2 [Fusobacterium periodonticum]EKA94705.1 translation initiation factor IF-2 [Fusobacterium periodonticum D10]KGE62279.1 translation initiation factor IF-2 [Fusobacterium periodonticum 2_1_31]
MKVRVHELAKKYELKNKEFLEILKKDIGVSVTSHLSNLDEDQVKKIDDYFAKMNMLKVETVEPVKMYKEKKEEKPIRKIIDEDEIEEGQKNNKKPKIQQKIKKNNNITFDEDGNSHKNKSKKKKGRRTDFVLKTVEATPDVVEEDGIKIIKFRGELTLGDFAEKLGVNSGEIIKKLFLKGQMLTINSPITLEMAEELAGEYDALVEEEQEVELDFGEKFALEIEDREADLKERPPVITIMGHVDHGKTSLLDAIRTTNVVEGEAGGITQKIGAYQVVKDGKRITFIDTPGHEAFTDMRARGAQVTDIAILVVAADDGVMPQTVEAISHAKVAKVPIIVAVNKIDKPEANPMKVKQELMEHGIVSVEWGGDVEFVEVSAKKKINLDGLLDTILITSEILELKGNVKKRAKGVVLESRLDPKIGPIADILVQEGTLKIGDVIVAGEVQGKVKALLNDKGERVNTAIVSQPVEVIGFNNVPDAGDTMYVIQNEQHAKRIVEEVRKERKIQETTKKTISLESLSDQLKHEDLKELNLILRADSKGSVDALRDSLLKLSNDEVAVNIIQAASGAITESDIKLAEAAGAIIIGFNVRPTTKALKEAETNKVEIRTSGIIYHIIEDIEKALAGMLDPEFKEEYQGRIEIKKVFKVSKVGNVAGCVVIDGKVKNDSNIRILRDNVVIYEGKLASLKRFKDDAKEVVAGQECGLGVENFNDIKEGDVVEAFEMVEIKRTLK